MYPSRVMSPILTRHFLFCLPTASDVEFGGGIRRAESCDSVASDSSVLDMQPDMPRIGQLEFALEYDR